MRLRDISGSSSLRLWERQRSRRDKVVGRLDCIDDAGVDLKSDGTKSQSSIDADE